MGVLCSTIDKEGDDPPEGKAQVHLVRPTSRRLRKMPQFAGPTTRSQSKPDWRDAIPRREFDTPEEYLNALEELRLAEKAQAFDHEVVATASKIERLAVELVRKIRAYDWETTYGKAYDAHGKPTGKRTEGEHFLGNVELINQTELMKIARKMPKGAHLHIHFNSCLPARFLIRQARHIEAMYIRSTQPLTKVQNWDDSRISFMVMTRREATHTKDSDGVEREVPLGNIFQQDYVPNRWMLYKDFQANFKFPHENNPRLRGTKGAELWLERKMLISEEEAHGIHQTGRG